MRKSSWVLFEWRGKFLLLKRGKKSRNPGLWNFPGGNVDEGQTPKSAAVRELEEEAGLIIKKKDLRFLTTIATEKRVSAYYHYVATSRPKVLLNKESSKFKWMSFDEFKKSKLHNSTKRFFKQKDAFFSKIERKPKKKAEKAGVTPSEIFEV